MAFVRFINCGISNAGKRFLTTILVVLESELNLGEHIKLGPEVAFSFKPSVLKGSFLVIGSQKK